MPATLPSVPQMVNRSTSGHQNVLRNISHGRAPWPNTCRSMSELRGRRTVLDTLSRWDCIVRTDDGFLLTERGRSLLAAFFPERSPDVDSHA